MTRPPEQAQLDACTCDAFALTADRHRAHCPVGATWAIRRYFEILDAAVDAITPGIAAILTAQQDQR